MNQFKSTIFIILIMLLANCKKYERSNPNDLNGGEGTPNVSFDNFIVVADNNNNEVMQANEDISLQIFTKNTGSKITEIATVTVTSTSNLITIKGFEKAQAAYSYVGRQSLIGVLNVKIAGTAKIGSSIPVSIQFTDKSNRVFTSTFSIVVKEPVLSILEFNGSPIIYGVEEKNMEKLQNYSKGLVPILYFGLGRKNDAFYDGNLKVKTVSKNPKYPYTSISVISYQSSQAFVDYFEIPIDCLPANVPDGEKISFDVIIFDKFNNIVQAVEEVDFGTQNKMVIRSLNLEVGATIKPGTLLRFAMYCSNLSSIDLKLNPNIILDVNSKYVTNASFTMEKTALNAYEDGFPIYFSGFLTNDCVKGQKVRVGLKVQAINNCPTTFEFPIDVEIQ